MDDVLVGGYFPQSAGHNIAGVATVPGKLAR